MSRLPDSSKVVLEHDQAVEFALSSLKDYDPNLNALRADSELLWEEVVGSVKRFYRIRYAQNVDISDRIRFALQQEVNLYKVVEDLNLHIEIKECALKLLSILEKTDFSNSFRAEFDAFLSKCERSISSQEHLKQITFSTDIAVSSGQNLAKVLVNPTVQHHFSVGGVSILRSQSVELWKVGACDGIGFLAGGPKAAAAASAISVIMQL